MKRIVSSTRRGRKSSTKGSRTGGQEKNLRAGWTCLAEPAGGSGAVHAEIFRLRCWDAPHRRATIKQEAIAAETVRSCAVRRGRPRAQHRGLAGKSPACCLLVGRHYDRVGVLASVFDRIQRAGINVQETENIVFEGAKAAVARIHLGSEPSPDVLDGIQRSNSDILELTLLPL